MPKIIDDLNAKILVVAKKQVLEKGYKSMTIRSVAVACGVATGTIYNYYSSKESIVAAFMLNDWIPLEKQVKCRCESCKDPVEACRIIYEGLLSFDQLYHPLFMEDEAIQTAGKTIQRQHPKLRKHLAELLGPICRIQKKDATDFLAEFIAEALLAWSLEGRAFTDLEPIIESMMK